MSRVQLSAGRRRRDRAMTAAAVITLIAIVRFPHQWLQSATATDQRSSHAAEHHQLADLSLAWPRTGAAALAVGNGNISTSGDAGTVPIASLAKVMTAVVVLRSHPLAYGSSGFWLTITPEDVADTAVRRAQGQSVVAVEAGERLSERQALYALLLPSANNIAITLARVVSGSPTTFVEQMNQEARRLDMDDTSYTDPSGFDSATVSTAHDQVVLARAAMRISAFREIVDDRAIALPVAGVVTNTDTLVGHDGFLGIKTGSDQAAGGCFLFARRLAPGAHTSVLYGVVLGQRGGPLIAAGLDAAHQLAASAVAVL